MDSKLIIMHFVLARKNGFKSILVQLSYLNVTWESIIFIIIIIYNHNRFVFTFLKCGYVLS